MSDLQKKVFELEEVINKFEEREEKRRFLRQKSISDLLTLLIGLMSLGLCPLVGWYIYQEASTILPVWLSIFLAIVASLITFPLGAWVISLLSTIETRELVCYNPPSHKGGRPVYMEPSHLDRAVSDQLLKDGFKITRVTVIREKQ